VTAAGAVVLLDPDGGRVRRTLVPSGAVGDSVQLTPDDSYVYYEVGTGCRHQVWRVRVDGDSPQMIAAEGSRPALSSDGRRLAFARQRFPDAACPALSEVAAAGTFQVVLVDLDGLVSTPYPMPPRYAATGLPAPVSHLSWSPDGTRLAVSIRSVQDNEGWQLHLMTLAKDRYYVSEDLAGDVPPGGAGDRHRFYSEGSYLPGGAMFVVHRCCTGYPLQAPEVAMEKIAPATGATITRVAVGRATVEHTSLTSDATGRWLMYLSGTDLLVSDGGRTPVTLASGYLAADW
jgi:Tol biopolymer transport system component